MDFLKILFVGTEVLEGCSSTETCAFGTRTRSDNAAATGTIGGTTVTGEFKLVDVPEPRYASGDRPSHKDELFLKAKRSLAGTAKTRSRLPRRSIRVDAFTPETLLALRARKVQDHGPCQEHHEVVEEGMMLRRSLRNFILPAHSSIKYTSTATASETTSFLWAFLTALLLPILAEQPAKYKFGHAAEPGSAIPVKEPAVHKAR